MTPLLTVLVDISFSRAVAYNVRGPGTNPMGTLQFSEVKHPLLWWRDFLPKYSFKLYYFYYFEMFYD